MQTAKVDQRAFFPKDELYERYRKLVHSVASKYARQHFKDYDEIAAEGFVGLVKAYNKYNWNEGEASFYTYAYLCVENEIKMYLRKKRSLKVSKAVSVSFEHQIASSNDGNAITIEDVLGYEADYTTIFVQQFVAMLDDRDRYILQQRLLGVTNREIAKALNLHPTRISKRCRNMLLNYQQNNKNIKRLVNT